MSTGFDQISSRECRAAGSDFWLQPKNVSRSDARRCEGFVLKQLSARPLMVKLITHQLSIGAVPRKVHFLDQNCDHASNFRIAGNFDGLSLVSGCIPHFDLNVTHEPKVRRSQRLENRMFVCIQPHWSGKIPGASRPDPLTLCQTIRLFASGIEGNFREIPCYNS